MSKCQSRRNSDSFRVERNENYFLVPFEGKDLFRGVTLDMLKDAFARLIAKAAPSSKIFNVYEEVSLEEKKARVECGASVSDDALRAAVVDAGYEVTGIEG